MKSKFTTAIAPIMVRSYEQLGIAIRRIRKLQNLSQSELAQKAGVTQTTISNLERGKTVVEVGTLMLILSALEQDIIVAPRPKANNRSSLEGLF